MEASMDSASVMQSSSRSRRKSRKPLKSCIRHETLAYSPTESSTHSPPSAPLTPPLSDVQSSLSPCSSVYSSEDGFGKMGSKIFNKSGFSSDSDTIEKLSKKSIDNNRSIYSEDDSEKNFDSSCNVPNRINSTSGSNDDIDGKNNVNTTIEDIPDSINSSSKLTSNDILSSLRGNCLEGKSSLWSNLLPSALSMSPIPSDDSCEKEATSPSSIPASNSSDSVQDKISVDSFSQLLDKLKRRVPVSDSEEQSELENNSEDNKSNSDNVPNILQLLNSLASESSNTEINNSGSTSNSSPATENINPASNPDLSSFFSPYSSSLAYAHPLSKMFLSSMMNPLDYSASLQNLGLNLLKSDSPTDTEESIPEGDGWSAANFLLQQQMKCYPYLSSNPFLYTNDVEKGISSERIIKSESGGRKPRSMNHTKSFHCSLCSKRFSQKEELEKHVMTHSKDELGNEAYMQKSFACTECSFRTKYKFCLQRHMHIHSGEKPLVCPHCRYRSISKVSYDNHLRTHTGEKPFLCPYCDYKSSFKNNLTKHLKTHSTGTDSSDKSFQCSKCFSCFSSQVHLKSHMKLHVASKNSHSCSVCHFTFLSKFELEFHMRSHVVT